MLDQDRSGRGTSKHVVVLGWHSRRLRVWEKLVGLPAAAIGITRLLRATRGLRRPQGH
jgi:hypothetical protein